ncbi:hypothetical protein IJT17_08095, partial [bacterium]|nr:hypothetical protein [bacterium]
MSSNAKALTMEEEEELEKHRTTAQNNKRCTNCNGTLVFDPNTQMMKCEYCEAVFEIPRELDDNEKAAEANAKDSAKAGAAGQTPTDKQQKPAHKARNRKGERPLEEATEDNKEACDWGSKKKMITCKTCGAQTIYDAVQTISACPYCDSNQVMEKNDDQNGLAPTGICVFKVDRAKAREQFHDWVNGLWFAPNKLKKVANADSIEGLYLPHWTYDTQVRATYTGEYGVEDDDDNVTWYNCSGKIEHFFDDFLIPACKKENNHILEDLEPFNTNDYEDYKPEYMVGYAA